MPGYVITVSVLFHHPPPRCNFRRRSCTSGSNRRSAWRVWLERSRCLRAEHVSPALRVTPVSTTMTRPPARRAHLGPILTGWNVRRTQLIYIAWLTASFPQLLLLLIMFFFFLAFSPQRVSIVRQALSPSWVTSINGGIFFLQTWRHPVSTWATPNVTVWTVGVL